MPPSATSEDPRFLSGLKIYGKRGTCPVWDLARCVLLGPLQNLVSIRTGRCMQRTYEAGDEDEEEDDDDYDDDDDYS